MTTTDAAALLPYLALGQTTEEALLLLKHDEGETLHAFQPSRDPEWACSECGDTEDALMHSGVWRNVEPLLDAEQEAIDDMRLATEAETTDYLAGHLAIPGAVETEHALMVPRDFGRVVRSTTAYDPDHDMARVDEATVRRTIGIGVSIPLVGTILLQGHFACGGRGCYGSVIVLCQQSNGMGYSTNRAIVRAEDGEPLRVFAEAGHYDMTREQAEADLATRR